MTAPPCALWRVCCSECQSALRRQMTMTLVHPHCLLNVSGCRTFAPLPQHLVLWDHNRQVYAMIRL